MKQRRLRADDNALEDLPLRLLIIAIVMAITVPVVFVGLRDYRIERAETVLETELERLKQLGIQVYTMGVGTAQTIEIDIPDETESVTLGGPLLSRFSSTIWYQIQQRDRNFMLIKRGAVSIALTTPENDALTFGAGLHTLSITKRHWDADRDDVPDLWERLYGEVSTNADVDRDSDGDGSSDIEELVAQTDPTDPDDRPASAPNDPDGDGIPDKLVNAPPVAYLEIEYLQR